MTQVRTLDAQLREDGQLDAKAVSQQSALDEANAQGWGTFVVNCDRARSRSAVLRAIAKAVDYPEFFGSDLDALYDCLCDTVLDQKVGLLLWLDHLHSGDPALESDARAIIDVCGDVVEFAKRNDRLFAFAVLHAGKHPDPEPGVLPTPYSGHRDT